MLTLIFEHCYFYNIFKTNVNGIFINTKQSANYIILYYNNSAEQTKNGVGNSSELINFV